MIRLLPVLLLPGIIHADPEPTRTQRDARLVRQLIEEDLDDRRFAFGTVMSANSGKKVIPLDRGDPVHSELLETLERHLAGITERLSQTGSPVRRHGRINEVSADFEAALLDSLDAEDHLECMIPRTRDGREQRSGYPDLRVVHKDSGEVFYLDPKLVSDDAWDSSFRTFYFEPKKESLKITDDAVHLLVGIGHDGNTGAWAFEEWKIVDLSTITLRLKPEFQASNDDLYPPSEKE